MARTLASIFGIVALTVLAWLRLPSSTAGTLWAEDGGIFLRQALDSNFVKGIFEPYEGYLHVVPRILSHIALRLGRIDDYAVIISLLSCLTVAVVGCAVYYLSSQLIPSVAPRLMLAIIPILLPVAPFEALGNTANLHWYMLWLVVWLLLYRPSRWLTSSGLAVAAFLAAATEIQAIVFLPVGLIAGWRDRKRIPPTAGLIVGLIMQVSTSVRFPRSVSPDVVPWDIPSLVIGWLLQGVESTVQPSGAAVGPAWNAVGGWLLVIPALSALAVAVIGWRVGGVVRFGSLGFLMASGVFWAAAQILNNRKFMNYAEMAPADWLHFGYLRYAVAPGMFFLGAVVILSEGSLRRSRPEGRLWLGPMLLGAVALILFANFFPTNTGRWDGPVWAEQVASARVSCESNPTEQTGTALVAPLGWEYGKVPIPCSRLRQ